MSVRVVISIEPPELLVAGILAGSRRERGRLVRSRGVSPGARKVIGRERPITAVYATFNHRTSSGIVGRLPYDRIPTRKIFAVTRKKSVMVAIETRTVRTMCHSGGSATSVRRNIVIGPKTGASEKPTASDESGFVISTATKNHGDIISIVIGAIICCASFSELQTAPAIA